MPTYQKEQPNSIKALFNDIARQYDVTNRVISLNMSKKWNQQLAHLAGTSRKTAYTLLDLCAGTGEVAFECLKGAPFGSLAYLLDFSPEMLAIAKKKAKELPLKKRQLRYLEADAQKIPLASKSIDYATMAYGIRNVKDPSKCFEEVYRVLKHGGNFAILELTRPQNRFLKLGHQLYTHWIMPLFGKLLTRNKEAYNYLCKSVQHFISPTELEKLLSAKGFNQVRSHSLAGGIATIIVARKL